MRTIHTMMTVPILLLFCSTVGAQHVSMDQIDQLDSLVFVGEFEKLAEALTSLPTNIDGRFDSTKAEYTKLLEHVKSLPTIPRERLEVIAKQHLESPQKFDAGFAGEKAAEAYRRFKTLAAEGDLIAAMRQHCIARYFQVKHIRSTQRAVNDQLASAESMYAQARFDEAYELIKSVEAQARKYEIFANDREHIEEFKRRIEKRIREEQTHRELFEQKEKPGQSIAVYVGWHHLVKDSDNKGVVWTFNFLRNSSWSLTQKSQRIATASSGGISIVIGYFLTKRIQIGAGFESGFYERNFIADNNWYRRHDVDYRMLRLQAQYYLRHHVGLRPYLGFGVGGTSTTRGELAIPLKIFDLFEDDVFRVDGEKARTYQITEETGIEYLRSPKSKLVFRLSLPVHYNLKNVETIGRLGLGVNLYAGVTI